MDEDDITLDEINNREIQKLLAPIVYLTILMIVGIPGNLTVLLIYWKRYDKSVYRTIIWTLAMTDFLFCALTLPFNIGRIIRYYTFYDVWVCKSFTTLIIFFVLFSSHLLLILSFHRFRQVCMPLRAQINPSNIRYWIAGGFVFAVIFDIPEFVLQPVDKVQLGHNITGFVCAVSFKNSIYAELYNGFSTFLFGAYALTLLILYLIIGRKMFLQRKAKGGIRTRDDDLSSKITKIAITVSVVFALSYLPLFTLKLLVDDIHQEKLNVAAFSVLKIFERSYAINHVANPFIYAFFDQRFRSHLKSLLKHPMSLKAFSESSSRDEPSRSADRTVESSLNAL